MSTLDAVQLTRDLIAIPSASQTSNLEVSDYLTKVLEDTGFEVERLEYVDQNDILKVSLIAKKGEGKGGLGFFSHSDTVPGAKDAWSPFEPLIKEGKLLGRGSCDMKGPLAATIAAAANLSSSDLEKPVYIVIAADEEVGFGGAKQITKHSETFKRDGWPDMGVIAEPTELEPVHAHKGGYFIDVTAHGEAAHTSTEKGRSANFKIAPFLADMAALKETFMTDAQFQDDEFNPPTNGFNMTLNDYGCANNVTAAKSTATLSVRSMPQAHTKRAVQLIRDKAEAFGLELATRGYDAFHTSPDSKIICLSLEATGATKSVAVPYGTEALVYQEHLPLVILGPGSIAQAHTIGEYIELNQLERAVAIYQKMIKNYCQN